ncbi:MAG TPA: PH domain-containing protein [Actinomycetota bacterium]|nr:PH domain-containing protein [Actinomycetota bacterium]
MPFPRRLLIEGEELVLDLRPHWIALVMPSLVTALVVIGYLVALGYAPDDGAARSAIVWGGLVLGLAVLVWYPLRAFIAWATSNFAVTTDRIIHREGFIAKRSMEIPLEAINDVRFQQSVLERVVGAGDLVIQSASEYGRNVFANVRNPEHVQRTIYQQGEANKQRMYQGGGSGPSRSAPSVTTELQRLAELRDRGVLTEAEFQNQKKKILGG